MLHNEKMRKFREDETIIDKCSLVGLRQRIVERSQGGSWRSRRSLNRREKYNNNLINQLNS